LANNYYRRSWYLAASVSFLNVAKDFPETRFREEAMYMNVLSLYQYARNSIRARQPERYQNAMEAYERFERAFPESSRLNDLSAYTTRMNNFLAKHND